MAFGQVSKLVDTDSFSETAVRLNFGDVGRGPEAARAYRELGIVFSGEGSSHPIQTSVHLGAWQFALVLRNHSDTSSAGEALIVRFDHPVRRVGFLLGNGGRETHAVLSAFTARGEALGSIEQKGIHPVRGPFVGLETSHPAGISTVLIDYGEEDNGEEIHWMWVDFLIPPTFRTCSAQICMGPAGGVVLETHVQVVNAFTQPVDVQLFFRDPEGRPLPVRLDGEGPHAVLDLTLGVSGSRQFPVESNDGALRVGYLCLESPLPVDAQAIFVTRNPAGEVVAEAGVRADRPRTRHITAVQRDAARGLDTGIAIANSNDREAGVGLTIRDEATGGRVFLVQRSIVVPAGHRLALFVSEIFDSLPHDFRARLQITSFSPGVAVTTVRTVHGIAHSSLVASATNR